MDHVALLKQFIGMCQSKPEILHAPEFGFFRDYLVSLGATLPPKPAATEKPATGGKCPMSEEPKEKPSEPEIPKLKEIPYPEIDNKGVIEAEEAADLLIGDATKEPTEDDIKRASDEKEKAQEAFSNGDFDAALTHLSAAIEANPKSLMLRAKRVKLLMELGRPFDIMAECDFVIARNTCAKGGYIPSECVEFLCYGFENGFLQLKVYDFDSVFPDIFLIHEVPQKLKELTKKSVLVSTLKIEVHCGSKGIAEIKHGVKIIDFLRSGFLCDLNYCRLSYELEDNFGKVREHQKDPVEMLGEEDENEEVEDDEYALEDEEEYELEDEESN